MPEVKFYSLIQISRMIKQNDKKSHDYLIAEYNRLSAVIKDYEIAMKAVRGRLEDKFFKEPADYNPE